MLYLSRKESIFGQVCPGVELVAGQQDGPHQPNHIGNDPVGDTYSEHVFPPPLRLICTHIAHQKHVEHNRALTWEMLPVARNGLNVHPHHSRQIHASR